MLRDDKLTVLAAGLVLLLVGIGYSQLEADPGAAVTIERQTPVDPTEPLRPPLEPGHQPRIQVAILLDTSGSMEGLIEQAKSELWRVVNELGGAKRDGRRPVLELALFEYGKSTLPASEGYIRLIVPLTTDLDRVSQELFALRTNGGSEYCGQVIHEATRSLDWSDSADDLKIIFIAGNEPFSQGPVDYRRASRAAIAKGIIVNTIHCGSGIPEDWKQGALLADGRAMAIDHNTAVAHIDAPQDVEIARLGAELNRTYVPYGDKGSEYSRGQFAQDANAASKSPSSAAERAVAKAGAYYRNAHWDLVDAVEEGKLDLDDVREEELPAEMRGMNERERKDHIQSQLDKRQQIQAKIKQLQTERRRHIAAKRKEQSQEGAQTLDAALVETLKLQAAHKQFEVE